MKTRYVLGFAFNLVGSKVILIKKNRPAWQRGRLNGIGGKVKEGEALQDAMVREFEEETNLRTFSGDWIRKVILKKKDFDVHIFISWLTHQEIHEAKTITDEEVRITDPNLLSNAISNLHWIIPLLLDANVNNVIINHE